MKAVYDVISKPNPAFDKIGLSTITWRDKDPSIGRKMICGIALTVSGLACLIDSIASLALAIITLPLEFVGIKLARSFSIRSATNALSGGAMLTIFNYDNLREKCLADKLDSRFSTYQEN